MNFINHYFSSHVSNIRGIFTKNVLVVYPNDLLTQNNICSHSSIEILMKGHYSKWSTLFNYSYISSKKNIELTAYGIVLEIVRLVKVRSATVGKPVREEKFSFLPAILINKHDEIADVYCQHIRDLLSVSISRSWRQCRVLLNQQSTIQ